MAYLETGLQFFNITGNLLIRHIDVIWAVHSSKEVKMSLLTALEICGNPYDLQIFVAQGKDSDLYGFVISRGPGHRFKPLISSRPFAKTKKDVLVIIRRFLEISREAVIKELTDKESIVAQILNPSDQEASQFQGLSPELIEKIMEALQGEEGVANTFKMISD